MTLLERAHGTRRGPRPTEAARRRAPPRSPSGCDNFEGPFDLLLQLIGKHQLDVTEVALHRVTDDFIAYITALGDDWDLDEATEFLVVAATLLDLKAARLLPDAEVEDEEDLPCSRPATCCSPGCCSTGPTSRSRRSSSSWRRRRCAGSRARSRWRSGSPGCCPRCCSASTRRGSPSSRPRCSGPSRRPTVGVDHLHAPRSRVAEHAAILRERLAELGRRRSPR